MPRFKADDRIIVTKPSEEHIGRTGTVYGAASYMTAVANATGHDLTPLQIPYLVHLDGDPEGQYIGFPEQCLDFAALN